jgi:hypothetical protein
VSERVGGERLTEEHHGRQAGHHHSGSHMEDHALHTRVPLAGQTKLRGQRHDESNQLLRRKDGE